MKALKIALVAMSLCAAVAHAEETTSPAAEGAARKASQPQVSRTEDRVSGRSAAPAESKGEACVGPLTFCDIFSGG